MLYVKGFLPKFYDERLHVVQERRKHNENEKTQLSLIITVFITVLTRGPERVLTDD